MSLHLIDLFHYSISLKNSYQTPSYFENELCSHHNAKRLPTLVVFRDEGVINRARNVVYPWFSKKRTNMTREVDHENYRYHS